MAHPFQLFFGLIKKSEIIGHVLGLYILESNREGGQLCHRYELLPCCLPC